VEGFVRAWPTTSSSKQVLLLNELEEVLETAGAEATAPVLGPLLDLLARCVGSSHFQVAERALFLWHNETLGRGVLGRAYTQNVLPVLFEPLHRQASEHWNVTVESLATSVMKLYSEADPALYERCTAALAAKQREGNAAAEAEAARRAKWAALEAAAEKLPPPQ
jgi:serine/threonine-protein phosphatase 2A regulatory subunit B'